jgi:hypothetical protein
MLSDGRLVHLCHDLGLSEQARAVIAAIRAAPPSLREVERRLDQPEDGLRPHLPGLCHAIAERYLRDRKAHGRRARQTLRDEVRQATFRVHVRGRYPGADRVAPLLSQPDALRGGVAKVAWQEALRDLGWLGGTGSTAQSVRRCTRRGPPPAMRRLRSFTHR